MAVPMDFTFVAGVRVIMGTMLACMVMGMPQSISGMFVFVLVLVHVFVGMDMGVLMDVLLVPV